jgi:phospholipase/carboxylesterase
LDVPAIARVAVVGALGLIAVLAADTACQPATSTAAGKPTSRITVRPTKPVESCTPGLRPLGLGAERDGLLLIPSAASASKRLPLVVLLHGAGGSGQRVIRFMQSRAERDGFLLLAPDSRGGTWDAIRGDFGPDVDFLNSALQRVFAQCAVDKSRLVLAGFSDGASYALALGLTNGDVFTHLIAFSPGIMAPAERRGSPAIFVSHGKADKILPIEHASRVFVPILQRLDYRVRYREFDGPHTVPDEVVEEAVTWFAGRK